MPAPTEDKDNIQPALRAWNTALRNMFLIKEENAAGAVNKYGYEQVQRRHIKQLSSIHLDREPATFLCERAACDYSAQQSQCKGSQAVGEQLGAVAFQ